MKSTRSLAAFGVVTGAMLTLAISAQAAPGDVPPDPKVVEVLNTFCTEMAAATKDMASPSDADISALGKKAMKFYHKSHYNNAKDNLKDDRLRFSFKKGVT